MSLLFKHGDFVMRKSIRDTGKKEEGFAFVMAMLATLLLVSLTVLIFSLTTRDIRITVKAQGEKLAKSAAETGIYNLVMQTDVKKGDIANYTGSFMEGTMKYTIEQQPSTASLNKPKIRTVSGSSLDGGGYNNIIHNKRVTGSDTRLGTQITVDVGIEYYNPNQGGTTHR
jgi:hypothetical protein